MNRKIDLKNAVLILAMMMLLIIPFAFSVNAEATYYAEEDCVTGYVVPSDGSGLIMLASYGARVYYLDPVKVIGEDEDSYYFMYDGEEYSLPKTEITFDKPVYTAPNAVAQEIIDKALKYAPYTGAKTCYDYGRYKYNSYCGIYGPGDGAVKFTCAPYVEEVVNSVMQKHVPTYIFPRGGCKAMQNAGVAFNKGYSQQYSYKDVKIEYIRPGDVILFDQKVGDSEGDLEENMHGDGEADHVGIYLGGPGHDYIHCAYRGEKISQYKSDGTRMYAYGGVMINHLTQEKKDAIVRIMRPYPETIKPINKTMYTTPGYPHERKLFRSMDGARNYNSATDYITVPKNSSLTFLYTTASENKGEADIAYVKYNGKYYFTTREPRNDSGQLLITPQGMANCTFKLSASTYKYSGSAKKPTVTVKYGSKTLTKDTHYTVTYSNNTNIGKAKVIVKGKESSRYYGTKTLYFTIKPATPSNVSLKRASKTSIKVNWTPVKGSVTGYEIKYSTSSTMSGAKTAYVKGSTAKTNTLKSLSSGKKYYVKVRAYKTVSGTKYYSSWSSTKYVK